MRRILREMQRREAGEFPREVWDSAWLFHDTSKLRICGNESFALLGQWKLVSWVWKSTVINKRPVSLRQNPLGCVSSGSVQRSCGPEGTEAVSPVGSQTWSCASVSSMVLVWVIWGGHRELPRLGTMWQAQSLWSEARRPLRKMQLPLLQWRCQDCGVTKHQGQQKQLLWA